MISADEERGLRLFLLIDETAKTMRKDLLKHLGATEQNIQLMLNRSSVKNTLYRLKSSKVLNQLQWKLLFPKPPQIFDINKLDATIIFLLYLNIKKPAANVKGDIEALRALRNQVIHKELATSQSQFDSLWLDISSILHKFGADLNDIALLKGITIDVNEANRLRDVSKKLKECEAENIALRKQNSLLENAYDEGMWYGVPMNVTAFTSRENELSDIHYELNHIKTASQKVGIVLHGMGGVGKTEIAIRYCRQYHEQYHNVVWVDMQNEENANTVFKDIANNLNLSISELSPETVIQKVYQFISSKPSLIIFDNLDSTANIQSFLPELSPDRISPAILITSQSEFPYLNRFTHIRVGLFSTETSQKFIIDNLEKNLADVTLASDLSVTLGNLPLALQQSVCYINSYGISIEEYLTYFNDCFDSLVDEPLEGHEKTVFTTIHLSIKALENTTFPSTPLALDILHICSCLSSSAISQSLMYYLPDEEKLNIDHALTTLVKRSFLKRSEHEGNEKEVHMHNITRKVIRTLMRNDTTLDNYTERSLRLIRDAISDDDGYSRNQYTYGSTWVDHACVLVDEIDNSNILMSTYSILPTIMQVFENQSRYEFAERFFVHFIEKKLSFKYKDKKLTCEIKQISKLVEPFLYVSLLNQRKYHETLEWFKYLHADIAATVGNTVQNIENEDYFSNLVDDSNEMEDEKARHVYVWKRFRLIIEAEKGMKYYLATFVEIFENIESTKNESKTSGMIKLQVGEYLLHQNKLKKALQFFTEAYNILEPLFGEESLLVVGCKCSIARVLITQNKIQEGSQSLQGISVLKQVIETDGDHRLELRLLLSSLAEISNALYLTNNPLGALNVINSVLALKIQIFGIKHEKTIDTMFNIAYVNSMMLAQTPFLSLIYSNFSEVVSLFDQIYKSQIELLGKEHHKTVFTKVIRTWFYFKLMMEDERMIEELNECYEQLVDRLGEKHNWAVIAKLVICWCKPTMSIRSFFFNTLDDELSRTLKKVIEDREEEDILIISMKDIFKRQSTASNILAWLYRVARYFMRFHQQ